MGNGALMNDFVKIAHLLMERVPGIEAMGINPCPENSEGAVVLSILMTDKNDNKIVAFGLPFYDFHIFLFNLVGLK